MKVAILMGSKSDMPIMEDAANMLKEFGIESDIFVASAHRTPEKVHEICKNSEDKYEVMIAGAGKAAHLPGVVASLTTLPVIGVPIKTSDLGGVDSLYSIVQMPSGIPVATVAINGAKNAGILATQIIALKNDSVKKKFIEFREEMKKG